jgi:signal transduction histidine kinase
MRRPQPLHILLLGAALVGVALALAGVVSRTDPAVRTALELTVGLVVLLALLVAFRRFAEGGRSEYHRSLRDAAIAQERRRLARELHDGLAQDLWYLVTQTRLLALRHGELDGLAALEKTSQRALEESQVAIGALVRPGSEPLDVALEAVVADLSDRMGTSVRLHVGDGVAVEPATRDALVRIVREAITNAVRHGGASAVSVELKGGTGICLRVVDDGRGFEVDGPAPRLAGFGLVSMRERAEQLGGRLTVASRPGQGTRVELVLP